MSRAASCSYVMATRPSAECPGVPPPPMPRARGGGGAGPDHPGSRPAASAALWATRRRLPREASDEKGGAPNTELTTSGHDLSVVSYDPTLVL